MLDFIEPTLKEELRSFAVDVWQVGGVCFSLNFPFLSPKKQIPSQALVAESAFARWNSGPEEKTVRFIWCFLLLLLHLHRP